MLACFILESHHKLIRWRLVTHAAIDGYSRLVLYAKCVPNNFADTVLQLCLGAVNCYGLPSRVRSDQGLENTYVARYTIERRGPNRRSMIVGSSTHNQRIERLWRDMHKSVTILFYKLFYYMEDEGLVDPLNELHMWSLQYVFIPRINKALIEFVSCWNNHSIRTAHNHTPQQLLTSGLLLLQLSNIDAFDLQEEVDDYYGLDEDGPIPSVHVDGGEGVHVPQSSLHLDHSQLATLRELVDPTGPSNNYGVDSYEQSLQYITTITPSN